MSLPVIYVKIDLTYISRSVYGIAEKGVRDLTGNKK